MPADPVTMAETVSDTVRLTKAQRELLRALIERPLDIYDLSDEVNATPQQTFTRCKTLRARKLVDWMYPEDEVCLSDLGLAALESNSHE